MSNKAFARLGTLSKQAVAEVVPSSCQGSARFLFFLMVLDFSLSYFFFTINLKTSLVQKCSSNRFWSKVIKAPKKLGPKSVVNIGSLSAEIPNIFTSVAGTNVALTNVIMTFGIC